MSPRRTTLTALVLLAPFGAAAQTNIAVLLSSTPGTPLPSVGPGYVVVPTSHADVNTSYDPATKSFSLGFRNDNNGTQYTGTTALAHAVTNQRTTVPAGSQWAFLGAEGAPLWLFPATLSTSTNRRSLYLGFAGYGVPTNTFVSNRFNLRVAALENLTTPGAGQLYGYEVSGGNPTIRLSSSNAYTNDFPIPAGGHSHLNLAFTASGMFRVWVVASGTLLSTGENVESEPLPLYFGVEQWEIPAGPSTYAAWRDAEFLPPQANDPAVSGPAADPDADSFSNLEEYAFGGKPLVPDAPLLQPQFRRASGQPVLTARARTNATDLTWRIESAPGVSAGASSWSTNGVSPLGPARPVAGQPGLAEQDYQLGGGAAFGRIKVATP